MLKKRLLVLSVMISLLLVTVATRPVSATVYCSCAMVCGGDGGGAQCQYECDGSGSASDWIHAIGACCSQAGRITPIQCVN